MFLTVKLIKLLACFRLVLPEQVSQVSQRSTYTIIMTSIEQKLSGQIERELMKHNAAGSKVLIASIFMNESLIQVMNKTNFFLGNITQPVASVSFISTQVGTLLGEYYLASSMPQIQINAFDSTFRLVNGKRTIHSCKLYRDDYREAIKSYIDYFQFNKIAIIASSDICYQKFAMMLHEEILTYQKYSNDQALYPALKSYKLTAIMSTNEIQQILYNVKLIGLNTIILILPNEFVELVFKVAPKFALLSDGNVWMTVETNNLQNKTNMPQQWITVREEKDPQQVICTKEDVINITVNLMQTLKPPLAWHSTMPSIPNDYFENVAGRLLATNTTLQCQMTTLTSIDLFHSQNNSFMRILSWNQKIGITIHSPSSEFLRLYKSGSMQEILNVVTIIDEPFTMVAPQYKTQLKEKPCEHGLPCKVPILVSNKTAWNDTCCVGHSIDIIILLVKDVQFTVNLYVVRDGHYGAKKNGIWHGMIGDIVEGMADLAVAGLTMNNERLEVVDFSYPFMVVDLGIMISTKDGSSKFINFTFLTYISEKLLWSILGVFLLGMTLVYCFENEQNLFRERSKGGNQKHLYSWKEGFTYFSGLTFQRDLGGKNPKRYAARVTAVVFAFAMVIVMTAYTAVLTASTVKQEERDPFLGIKDQKMVNPTPDFKFATISATSTETFFRDAPDQILHRMYIFMKKYNTNGTSLGISNLINNKIQGFVNERPFLEHYASKQRDCSLRVIGLGLNHISYAVALKKRSPWTHAISNSIRRNQENQKLAKINKKWLSGPCVNLESQTVQHESYSVQYFGGLFIILISAVSFAFLLLAFEHICSRYHGKIPMDWYSKKYRQKNPAEIQTTKL